MSVSAQSLSAPWLWAALILGAIITVGAVVRAPWGRLKASGQLHVWLGSCVAVMVTWSIHPVALAGLDFHFLGAALFALMFGPALAIAGFAVALAGLVAWGRLTIDAAPFDFLLLAVLPIGISVLVLRVVERVLPRNFFIYVFVVAFFGAGLSTLVSGLVSTELVAWFAEARDADIARQFTPFVIFLAFAEATLTGMLATLMVVYRPHWVGTFDDARYLRAR